MNPWLAALALMTGLLMAVIFSHVAAQRDVADLRNQVGSLDARVRALEQRQAAPIPVLPTPPSLFDSLERYEREAMPDVFVPGDGE